MPRPWRVVVLYQFEPGVPATIAIAAGLRAELDVDTDYVLYSEYLDRFRFPGPADSARSRDWLRARFAAAPPDLVVAVGHEAVGFLASAETAPWPGVPVVFAVEERAARTLMLPPTFTGIAHHFAARETVELALRLLPATRHVVLVGGASAQDQAFTELLRDGVAPFAGRVDALELIGLTAPVLEQRLRALPDDSVVLFASYLQDGSGRIWTPQQMAPRISAAARAPLFSIHSTLLGSGIMGGVLVDYEQLGRSAGKLVGRILAGEAPAAIPVQSGDSNRAVVDARQLDRWHIPDARVPAGVEFRFREPTVWSRHRWTFAAIGFALVVQPLLIAGLLLERRRRRAAEVRARDNLAVVAHLNRVGAVGELAGSFAHELNSPLGAVLNNAQAARRFIAAGPEHAHEVVACLDDIVGDAGRAGEVVRRMRGIMRHGDVRLVQLDVSIVIRDALRLVEADARDRDVVLSVGDRPVAAAGERRRRPAGAGRLEPGHERGRCGQGGARGAATGPDRRFPAGRPRRDPGGRCRGRHPARTARAGVRPVLHHEAPRAGPGAPDQPLDRGGARR